jgi:BirA family biotin operon repressor/biotin-[acetyl-CoA-carboxylase] ligase
VNELGLIVYCGTLPSTQDLAREILQSPPVQIRAVVAEHQTAGRGRYGNRWLDTRGESLLMTLLLPLRAEESNRAGQLAFVLALAVADALREQTGLTVQFKWSNDVLVNRRKLAGILIETASDAQHQMWALAGVGLNLLQSDFPRGDTGECHFGISWRPGEGCSVEPLAQQLLRSVDQWMQVWRRDGLPPKCL